jgi:HEAT repeat protein
MRLLEIDLKAGLKDTNGDRVLDSIRMLGNMRHLQSTRKLKQLLHSRYGLIRAYVYEALLRVGDYSVLKSVREFLATRPEAPGSIYMPRDRLLAMQFRLASQVGNIKDPKLLPELEQFLLSPNRFTRAQALQAVRAINSSHSAPFFYKLLDDSDVDNRFGAMQGLLTIAGGGPIPWVPTWDEFRRYPDLYVAKCKEWWRAEGEYKAFYQTPSNSKSYPFLERTSNE